MAVTSDYEVCRFVLKRRGLWPQGLFWETVEGGQLEVCDDNGWNPSSCIVLSTAKPSICSGGTTIWQTLR